MKQKILTRINVGCLGELFMKYVFELMHTQMDWNGEESGSLIGIYSTEEEAEKARVKASKLPGFKDYIAGFKIKCYKVDQDYWTEGYQSIDNFDRYKKQMMEQDGKDCFDKILKLAEKLNKSRQFLDQKEIDNKTKSLFNIIGIILDNQDLYQISQEAIHCSKVNDLDSTEQLSTFVLQISKKT